MTATASTAQRRKWVRSEKINAFAAIGQVLSALFAAFVVIVSWQGANEARRQADVAQQALIAAERPWVKVVGLSDVRVTVREDMVSFFAKINVTNIGRSPAQGTFVRTRLLANASIDEGAQAANALCRDFIEGKYYSPTYELIFPDEDRILWDTALIYVHSISRENKKRIQEEFQLNRSAYGDEKAEEFRTQAAAAPLVAGLSLIGCVNYMIPIGRVVGQTAFVYAVNQACGKEQRELCAFYMTKPGVFEGKDVIIREPISGTFAR